MYILFLVTLGRLLLLVVRRSYISDNNLKSLVDRKAGDAGLKAPVCFK